MKNKSNSNLNETIEKQLLARLRQMGILLIGFCLCTFAYGLFLDPSPDDGIDTLEERESISGFTLLSPNGKVNAFGTAGAFFVVGSACICISAKRRKK